MQPHQPFGVLLIVATISLLLPGAPHAQDSVKQFSYVHPWFILKRSDGSCIATAHAFDGDIFVIHSRGNRLYVSLGNQKFNIPPGAYPVAVALHGSMIVPRDEITVNGTVEAEKTSSISIRLEDHQINNLPKASMLKLTLAGKDHLLFLDDTASMMRDLMLCEKYDSDPLKSAR
jgi:hypothetical protein